MPTPRPLARSASSRVENPGAHRSASSVAASGVVSGVGRPAARARFATASASIPLPSSLISIVTISPAVDALSVIVPSGGLPAATRAAGVSIPWLTAFRTRCRTGSIMRSIRYLSISVAWPCSSSVTFLSFSRARSRTTKGMRRKISPIGTRRIRMMPSRSLLSCRSIAWAFSWTALHSAAGTCRSIRASVSVRRARLITRSPTPCISSSSRVRSTRTT